MWSKERIFLRTKVITNLTNQQEKNILKYTIINNIVIQTN